jgi:hypothetical protein
MTIPIKEAVIKYKDYLVAVDETKKLLEDAGFTITPSNEFELGAEWLVTYNDTPIAEMMWNVPHMLTFKHRVPQEGIEFESDLVKNAKDWREFLNDMAVSIINTKETKR